MNFFFLRVQVVSVLVSIDGEKASAGWGIRPQAGPVPDYLRQNSWAQLPQLHSRGEYNDLTCCPALTFWAPALQEERKRVERKGETGGGGRRDLEQSRKADKIGENLVGFWVVGFFCYSSLHAEVVDLNTGWRIDLGRGKQRRKRDGSKERNFSVSFLPSHSRRGVTFQN